jgi:hypothetical protein
MIGAERKSSRSTIEGEESAFDDSDSFSRRKAALMEPDGFVVHLLNEGLHFNADKLERLVEKER